MEDLLEKVFITGKIKKIKLNLSGISLKEIEFKDGINILTGVCGTGKTRIIREIISQKKAVNGNEFINTLSCGQKQQLMLSGIHGLNPGMCIIIDNFICDLADSQLSEIMKGMNRSNNQYILTSIPTRVNKINLSEAKIIRIPQDDLIKKEGETNAEDHVQ